MDERKVVMTKEEVLKEISIASGDHDWDEVDRLYKVLFIINDQEEEIEESKKNFA